MSEKKAPKSLDDYIRLFSWDGFLSFLFSHQFVEAAENLDYLAFTDERVWMSHMKRDAANRTNKEGFELYSNKEKYEEYKQGLYAAFDELTKAVEAIEPNPTLTLDELKHLIHLFKKYRSFYTKAEFFYTDEAFSRQDEHPDIKHNFSSFEQLKLDGRRFLNEALLYPNSYLERILRKLNAQFGVPYEELTSYSTHELLDLFSGSVVPKETIADRSAYIIHAEGPELVVTTGDEARSLISSYLAASETTEVKGTIARKGKVTARAHVIKINANKYDEVREAVESMGDGDVLVAETTEPAIIAACNKASAIVTNQGGMMSHAAITARERGIPCIIATGNGTDLIHDGDLIEVDADNGVVRIIERAQR